MIVVSSPSTIYWLSECILFSTDGFATLFTVPEDMRNILRPKILVPWDTPLGSLRPLSLKAFQNMIIYWFGSHITSSYLWHRTQDKNLKKDYILVWRYLKVGKIRRQGVWMEKRIKVWSTFVTKWRRKLKESCHIFFLGNQIHIALTTICAPCLRFLNDANIFKKKVEYVGFLLHTH